MRGIVNTTYVETFLIDKGFTRREDEPFVYSYAGTPPIIIAIDEEHTWQDLDFLIEDWTQLGATELLEELLCLIRQDGAESI